jgi:hypothetical protein
LEGSQPLLAQLNHVLEALDAAGHVPEFARQVGLTYVAPRGPAVLDRITPQMLDRD